MKDYDAYLFDWDGTLADTLQVWLNVLDLSLKFYGLNLPTESLVHGLGDWSDLIPYGLPKNKLSEFADHCNAKAEQLMPEASLYQHAREALQLLKSKGKKLALVTASHYTVISKVLNKHKIAQEFDVIIYGSDISHHKPHPEGLLLAVERLGRPASAVMVGDSPRDIEAAQRAGIDSILFYPPSHSLIYDKKQLKAFHPVLTVSDWVEFQDQLE